MTKFYNWFYSNLESRNTDEEYKLNGNKIKNIINNTFHNYLIIYHPIGIDKDKRDITEEEVARIDKLNFVNNYLQEIAQICGYKKKYHLEIYEDSDFKENLQTIISSKYPLYSLDGSSSELYDNDLIVFLEKFNKIDTKLSAAYLSGMFDCTEDNPTNLRTESWKNYSLRLNLKFHSEISWGSFARYFEDNGYPINLVFPKEDYLPDDTVNYILRQLMRKYGDLYLFTGNGGFDKISFLLEKDNQYNFIAPKDKSWVIFTPYDLRRSIVAGNDDFIKFIDSLDVETLQANRLTRVDYFADKINPTYEI